MPRRTILSRAPWGALIAVGLVAGCGGSSSHQAPGDATAAAPPAPARTVAGAGVRSVGKKAAKRTPDSHPTAGPDVVKRSAAKTTSSAVTPKTKGTAPSSSRRTPQSSKLPRLFPAAVSHVFSGTGNETLGPASLASGATLSWQSDSEVVIRSPGAAAIHLEPPNGTMRIRPGDYADITVSTSGPWKLKLQVAS